MPHPAPWREEIEAAAAAGRISREDARLVAALQESEGALIAPHDRYRALILEVLADVGIQIDVQSAGPTPPRGPERRRKRRTARKRPRARPEPSTAVPEAQAPPEPAKKRPTLAQRRRAWAEANPADFEALLQANAEAVTDLIGRPVLTLPEATALDAVAEIVEYCGANDRKQPILAAAVAGAPAGRVHDDRQLPALSRRVGPVQGTFPFVPDEPGHVLPVFVHGGAGLEYGGNGPVPLVWRLWYEALLSAPRYAFGGTSTLPVILTDLIRFAGWERWRPERHLEPLAQALLALDGMRVPFRGTAWRPVGVTNIPASFGIDPATKILINVSLPAEARYGPQIDRQALRSLAPRSFPRYRGLLGLSAYWDQYGDGRGGADATADNPDRDRWPIITRETLRLMMFPGKEHREYRARAARHAKAMNDEGIIDLIDEHGGVRIFRPR